MHACLGLAWASAAATPRKRCFVATRRCVGCLFLAQTALCRIVMSCACFFFFLAPQNDAADYRPPADVEGAVPGANGTSAGNGAEEGGDSGNAPHLPQHISDVAAAVQAEILAALNSSAMPSSTSDSELAFPPHVYYLNARATLSYRIVLCDVSKTSTVGGDLAPLQ